jgi:hypothetical protein
MLLSLVTSFDYIKNVFEFCFCRKKCLERFCGHFNASFGVASQLRKQTYFVNAAGGKRWGGRSKIN